MAFAERITAHKTLLNSGDLSGVFLFLLVVNMRLSRIGLGMAMASMGMMMVDEGMHRATDSLGVLSLAMRLTQTSKYKSKNNSVSEAKRRKYKRQGR